MKQSLRWHYLDGLVFFAGCFHGRSRPESKKHQTSLSRILDPRLLLIHHPSTHDYARLPSKCNTDSSTRTVASNEIKTDSLPNYLSSDRLSDSEVPSYRLNHNHLLHRCSLNRDNSPSFSSYSLLSLLESSLAAIPVRQNSLFRLCIMRGKCHPSTMATTSRLVPPP